LDSPERLAGRTIEVTDPVDLNQFRRRHLTCCDSNARFGRRRGRVAADPAPAVPVTLNVNLADYHVPVHADVPPIDVIFVDETDEHVNPLGAKGLAELALVGVAPAVANAVYHATAKRVRGLPITPDKLL
jgi:hypothetical protein